MTEQTQPERRRDAGAIERVEEKVDLLLKLMTGNGDPSKGIVVRFDRVEQKMKWIWTSLSLAGIGIAKMIYDYVKKGGG